MFGSQYQITLTKVLRCAVIVLVCFGVLLQILGAAVSFWELGGSEDPLVVPF